MAVNPEGGDLRFQSEGRMQKHSGKDQAFLCGDTLPRGSNSSSARQWMKLNGKMVEVQVVEPEPRFLDGHESLENGKIEARLEPCQGVEDERFQHNIPGGENMTKGDDARGGGSSGVEKDESPRTLWHDRTNGYKEGLWTEPRELSHTGDHDEGAMVQRMHGVKSLELRYTSTFWA